MSTTSGAYVGGQFQGLEAVAGQADHLDVGEPSHDGGKTLADDSLVVGDEDPHDAAIGSAGVVAPPSGTAAATCQPDAVGPDSTSPPNSSRRSAMPRQAEATTTPRQGRGCGGGRGIVVDVSDTASGAHVRARMWVRRARVS